MNKKIALPLVGALFAIISVALVYFGNPGNMGLCTACFLRDISGGVGLHGGPSYIRPEIIGIVFGAMAIAMIRKEFAPKGGSSPATRFIIGACVMIGALIFLGCPTRMLLRMAGGDLNALVGLPGFALGIFGGMFFIKKGFTLKRTYNVAKTDGFSLPFIMVLLLIALLAVPGILSLSEAGPGAMFAPWGMALGVGLLIGAVGFVTRLCFVAGIRDSFLFKNFYMLSAFVALLVVAVIGNIITGQFNLGWDYQPVAHGDWLWNFLGLMLVGFGSVLMGGCPFRQVVMAGGGNSDSVAAVFGMIFGGAVAHNFSLASSTAGLGENGVAGFAVAMALLLVIAVANTFFNKKGAN